LKGGTVLKILHTSDWHLGRKSGNFGKSSEIVLKERYEDYFRSAEYIVDRALQERVDVFVIAGDLFDNSKILPDVLFRTENILGKLKENGIKTVVVEGNHDKPSTEEESWVEYLSKKKLIEVPRFFYDGTYHFEPIELNGYRIYGVPYIAGYISNTLEQLANILQGDKNIIVSHTAPKTFLEDETLPGCVDTETLRLFEGKVRYFAAGHYHSFLQFPANFPYFFIPGSPEYFDIGEAKKEFKKGKNLKQFIIFDTETGQIKLESTKRRSVRVYRIKDISEINNIEPMEGQVILIQTEVSLSRSQKKKIEEQFLESGVLCVLFEYVPKELTDFEITEEMPVSVLEERIISLWTDKENQPSLFAKHSKRSAQFLEKLKTVEPEKYFEEFDAFLEDLLGGEKDAD
jgi:DNA repair exonuclease SbcCD nuclease subunit